MLVLTRKAGERIHIGDSIVLTVVQGRGGSVRLGIEAPPAVRIAREELLHTGITAGGARLPGPSAGSGAGKVERPGGSR